MGCPRIEGCRRYFTGEEPRGHTEPCRDRIAQELMKEGDPRILLEVDRIVAQSELAREMRRTTGNGRRNGG
jgi:hypothetical protein